MDLLTLAKEFGVPLALVIFFIWQNSKEDESPKVETATIIPEPVERVQKPSIQERKR